VYSIVLSLGKDIIDANIIIKIIKDRIIIHMTVTRILALTNSHFCNPIWRLCCGFQVFDYDATCLFRHLTVCLKFLKIDNLLDFEFDSRKVFAKSFDSFATFSLCNDPFRNILSLTLPPFRVVLHRTALGSVCLSVEIRTPFANTFNLISRGKKIEPF